MRAPATRYPDSATYAFYLPPLLLLLLFCVCVPGIHVCLSTLLIASRQTTSKVYPSQVVSVDALLGRKTRELLPLRPLALWACCSPGPSSKEWR